MPGKNRDVDKAAYNYSLFYRTYFTIKEREKSMGFILFFSIAENSDDILSQRRKNWTKNKICLLFCLKWDRKIFVSAFDGKKWYTICK